MFAISGLILIYGIACIAMLLNPLATLYTLLATGAAALMHAAFKADADRTMDDVVPPDWYFVISYVLGILTVVLYIAVIVLLAKKASNEYFRKQLY